MIATFFIKEWVSVELSSSTTFEGGLKEMYEPEDKTYEKYSDDICDLYDSAKDLYEYGLISESVKNILGSYCEMFKKLYFSGVVYTGLESAAAFCVASWTFFMILYCARGSGIFLAYCCSVLALISHIVGIAIFIVATNTKLGSCDDFPDNGDLPELCAESGPFFSLVIIALLTFIVILFLIVACRVQRTTGYMGLKKDYHYYIQGNNHIQYPNTNYDQSYSRVQHVQGMSGYSDYGNTRKY